MTNTCWFFARRLSPRPTSDCRDRRHRNRPRHDRRWCTIRGNGSRRVAVGRFVVGGSESATAASDALLTVRPALVFGDRPSVTVPSIAAR